MSEEDPGEAADVATDPEPAENISGGAAGGGRPASFGHGDAGCDTRAAAVVAHLGELYWQKAYGGRPAFECLVRTILSQNTSDVASQPAHDALMERYGPVADTADEPQGGDGQGAGTGGEHDLAAALAAAERKELAETISGAGLYNQKADRIRTIAAAVVEEFGGAGGFEEFVRTGDPETVREHLLGYTGVGPKTADCVLLFAGGREGVFPVDTHVYRIYRRLGVAPPDADHEAVRAVLERELPPAQCGFGHTASIQFGREYCTARAPACLDDPEACPLADRCDRVGVDTASGEVVDPAETVD